MAMSVQEVRQWLDTLDEDGEVYIDEGGLQLCSGDATLEVGGEPNSEGRFTNYYVHCKTEWNDNWSCQCNDECPECHSEIEPYASHDNEGSEDDTEHFVDEYFVPEDGFPEGITKATELEGW